jgi:asparagine synthase (glutamine-hydrolysing)
MCGIAGIFAYHPAAAEVDERELTRMRDRMAARGPDGVRNWLAPDHRLGLAHRRLSIIDLSDRALQPMMSADGRFVIVFNGEIYNYAEVRTELEASGVELRTTSDTETLLHLYAREGPGMVRRLRGMFALAIWDVQKRGLFLARDPYGIKPLYVANDGWSFRFASQVKALLAGGKVSRDPEPAGLAGFHLLGHVPEPFTLFRDIRALPAGCTQWIDEAGPREPIPYVSLAAILAQGARHPAPVAEAAERLRGAILDSLRMHLVADVEVGIFLSAGIDSGALLGLIHDLGGPVPRAITLGFDQFRGMSEDEAPLATQVAALYGAKHVLRRVSEAEFRRDLPAILDAMDQPSIDGVNTWFVAKAAREAGLKAAISGVGGDELLAGYPSFVDLPQWRRLLGPLAAVPFAGALGRVFLETFASTELRRRPKLGGMLDYAGSWEGAYLLRRGLFLPRELPAVMGDAELAREGLRRLKPLGLIRTSLGVDPGTDVGRVCALESANYMKNQLLRDSDWAGMAHGLEIRTPLADIELLRALAPVICRLRPGRGKTAFALAPSRPLPAEVVRRAKTGFAVPTAAWMAEAGLSRAAVGDAKSKGAISRRWSTVVLSGAPPDALAA